MPALECQNGHVVTDQDAVRCPDCGSYVRPRPKVPAAYRPEDESAAPFMLLLLSVGVALFAGLVFVLLAGIDEGMARVVAFLILFGAATMWIVSCVAIGVRFALRSDD